MEERDFQVDWRSVRKTRRAGNEGEVVKKKRINLEKTGEERNAGGGQRGKRNKTKKGQKKKGGVRWS